MADIAYRDEGLSYFRSRTKLGRHLGGFVRVCRDLVSIWFAGRSYLRQCSKSERS
jgi:hypothetical protein